MPDIITHFSGFLKSSFVTVILDQSVLKETIVVYFVTVILDQSVLIETIVIYFVPQQVSRLLAFYLILAWPTSKHALELSSAWKLCFPHKPTRSTFFKTKLRTFPWFYQDNNINFETNRSRGSRVKTDIQRDKKRFLLI